jgi:hypothetical protein
MTAINEEVIAITLGPFKHHGDATAIVRAKVLLFSFFFFLMRQYDMQRAMISLRAEYESLRDAPQVRVYQFH